MTSFAHIGGGIAVAAAVQHTIFQEEVTPGTILVGAFIGLLPDIDSIFALLFGKWSPGNQMLSHHQYFTHTPIFFTTVSGIIWVIAGWKWAILFLSITISHLMMDSWGTDDGIMWLWPVNDEQFSIFAIDSHAGGIYGIQFYTKYVKTPRLILPEILIVAAGVIAVIRTILNKYFTQLVQ